MTPFHREKQKGLSTSTTPLSSTTSSSSPAPAGSALATMSDATSPKKPSTFLPAFLTRKPSRKALIITALLTTILLAAIIIPTAVVFTRRNAANAVKAAEARKGQLGAGSGPYIPSISHVGFAVPPAAAALAGARVQAKIKAREVPSGLPEGFPEELLQPSGEYGEEEEETGIFEPGGSGWEGLQSKKDSKMMVTLFYPIREQDCTEKCPVPYMPSTTARWANALFYPGKKSEGLEEDEPGNLEAGVFDNITYSACCSATTPLDPFKETVVVIEPQIGTSRLLYGGIAQEIASHGFAVLLVDHVDSSGSVEFINAFNSSDTENNATLHGNVDYPPFTPLEYWDFLDEDVVGDRVREIDVLMGRLSEKEFVDALLPKDRFEVLGSGTFNPEGKYAIIGHGVGGSTAVELFAESNSNSNSNSNNTNSTPRNGKFSLAIDLAGTPPNITNPIPTGTLIYFGLLSSPSPSSPSPPTINITRASDPHWPTVWPYLQSGEATAWTLLNGDIFDLSDVPGIFALGLGQEGLPRPKGLGEVEGWKAFGSVAQMVRAYVVMELRDYEEGAEMVKGLREFFGGEMVPYRPM